jgi:E3 ubiquitin-protein ligase mind-bomb
MKKCVQCRVNIEKMVPFMVCCGAPAPQEKGIMNNGCKDTSNAIASGSSSSLSLLSASTNSISNSTSIAVPNDVQKLQQQLQDIKEHVS